MAWMWLTGMATFLATCAIFLAVAELRRPRSPTPLTLLDGESPVAPDAHPHR